MYDSYRTHSGIISLVAPTALAQGSRIEGVRYSYFKKHDDGSWESVFYRASGNTVIQTYRASRGAQLEPQIFIITSGSFFDPLPADQCIQIWNTDDCGRLGVIKDDAIYLSFLINGRPLQQTGQLLISPRIPRQY